jgi:hypothetical protein
MAGGGQAGSTAGGSNAEAGAGGGGGVSGGASAGAAGSGGMAEPAGPMVDRADPQLFSLSFTAKEADDAASQALGKQNAFLDTRAEPVGKLVVFLHGAESPTNCGSNDLGKVVAGWGFHWFAPCYLSNYGVGGCGADIGGCRLEAFEGVDHHDFIDIAPPDSIEQRIVQGLRYLAEHNAPGDWLYYLDGTKPKWSRIVISGVSHGASSAGLIGKYRNVDRVAMLSGPLDSNQAWLEQAALTPIDRYFGFTHTMDEQHEGHLAAFETLGLPGAPVVIDAASPPYGDSHRFVTSRAAASSGAAHSSTANGKNTEDFPGWRIMYGAEP